MRRGALKPGGVVVEGTAGNTGIGLAMVANALGLRTVIVIPETQSQEKKDTLRALGGGLSEVPAVPSQSEQLREGLGPNGQEARARRGERRDLGQSVRQYRRNRQAHVETTGPEIWARPAARSMDSSARSALAEHSQASRRRCASAIPVSRSVSPIPPGAALFSYFTTGELKAEGSSITEGIRQGQVAGQPRGVRARLRIPGSLTRNRSPPASACLRMKGCALALRQG